MEIRLRSAFALTAVLAVLTAACASADQPTAIDLGAGTVATTGATTAETPAATDPATTDAATTDPVATEPAATEPSRERPDGPDAADFTLALGGPGGTFSLAEETRPVFLVFWAEW